jgi:Lon protease-like protein
MAAAEPDFPLFPLELVAVPAELVPLHIFEPRYRIMIETCLDAEREFGIVWPDEEGALRPVGCAMQIVDVLERMDDGRLNIVTRGTRPFRIVAEQDDLPYPGATVEFLEDDDEERDEEAHREAGEAYSRLVEEATDRVLEPEELDMLNAYAMAATVELGLEAKQDLLDLRSENARLRLVAGLFRDAVERLDAVERAKARAASNGKVRFG